MSRKKSKLTRKVGIPSETVVFIGDQKISEPKIVVSDLVEGKYIEKSISDYSQFSFRTEKADLRWIDIYGVHDTDLIQNLGAELGIHNLILADIANTEHNPKVQFFDDYLFVELKNISYNKDSKEVNSEQLSLLLGKNYVISFQESENDIFNFIRNGLKANHGSQTKFTPDYLFYALTDAIVDKYYIVLEGIGEDIELLEDSIIDKPTPTSLEAVHRLKRNLIFMRKATWPLREIIKRIEITKSSLLKNENDIYFRDLYEHIIQIIDTIETQREIVAELLDIYLSSVSYKLNEIMKVLTIISTIFIPLTFISSIYGMNFRFMPELGWKFGYPLIIAIMVVAGLWMLRLFRKKNWF